MALSCPNINLQKWKDLVAQLGDEDLAYFQWNKNSSEVGKQFQKLTAEEKAKTIKQNNSLFGLDINNQEKLEFHVNTLNVVSQFLENIGIEQRLVPEFLSQDGSIVDGALAAANFIEGTVDIIDDLEKGRAEAWNKLPEEAAHWWYRLLDTNSPLKKALWESHQTALKNDELYAGQYGKLVKSPSDLTEESIGQLIAEAMKRIETKNNSTADYSFFKKFLEWINSIIDSFKSTAHDPFEVAAMKILSSDMSDLMTWEEYRKLNNIVNFADVLTEQSVAPMDYTLIEDIGTVQYPQKVANNFTFNGDKYTIDFDNLSYFKNNYEINRDEYINAFNNRNLEIFSFIPKTGKASPEFNTKEELDIWVNKTYGSLIEQRQKQRIQEVRDNQIFFDRLLNKTFRKKSKFLPKTLRKYFDIIDAQNLNQLREWNISQELQQITKKLSEQEKKHIIETNGYTNIAPTLKVLPDLLQKYRKNPIVLSEPIKVDGAKKQELSILNGIKEMIKLENPNLKSITAEEFVAEAHTWLETNYLLGFANENSYLSYRTDQTFSYLSDRQTNEDVDITNLTEEEIQRLPFEERQRIANIVGLTKQNPDVYHNKVSLRFNDMYHLKSGHFDKSPSAWGNLTYFYTGKNKWKDAVLLHEIQNDNIEFLREFKAEKVDLETSLGRYLQQLNADLLDNITQIESGGKKIIKNDVWSTNPPKQHLHLNSLLIQLKDLPLGQGLSRLKESLNEIIELYKSDRSKNPDKAQEVVEKAYSQRRIFRDFQRRGGIKSLLTKEELQNLEDILKRLNTEEVEGEAQWLPEENQFEPGFPAIRNLKQKKQDFKLKTIELQAKITRELQKIYGDNAPLINLTAPARPRTKSQIRQGVQRSQELNENVNWLLAYSEKKILDNLSKTIEESKKNYIKARNATVANNFNVALSKITPEQYATLIENYKYNEDLLNRLIDEQTRKDIQKESSEVNPKDNPLISSKFYETINGLPLNTQEVKNEIHFGTWEFGYGDLYFDETYYYAELDNGKWAKIKKSNLKDAIIKSNTKDTRKKEQQTQFEKLKQQALDKKTELEKNYGKIEEEVKQTLEIEMNYFTPLVHHLIQKHINQYGKDFPMYFSGYQITKLTQGNDRTAWIYAGKDEIDIVPHSDVTINGKNYRHDGNMKYVPLAFYIDNKQYRNINGEFSTREDGLTENISEQEYNKAKQEYEKAYQQATERRAKEIKYNAGMQIGILRNEVVQILSDKQLEEGIKKLNEYKKQSKQNLDRVINTIMNISGNRPIETGAIYNAMSQINGIKLVWQDKIDGLKNNAGGYLVDLSNYNYNTPILYGLNTSKVVPINPNMVDNSEIQYSKVGSKQDIEGFKRFVNGSSTKLAQRPTLDGDYVTRLRKVAGQWNMSETGFIKTLGSKQELMRDVERQALSGIEVATASNGSFYFKMNGKKINPFKLKTQASRQKQTKTDKRIVGELRNHLMDFLKTLGVNVQEVDISKLDEGNIAEAEVIVKASGVVEKIIRIAKGYERQDTLAEEAAHIIVDMLGENNPQVREMLELITETQLFKDVIEGYSDLYDGDPMMLKKEAVGQMIAAYLTGNDDVKRQVSPTLWDKVISFFEWLFGKAKTYDETVFRQRLDKVFIPLVDQILEGNTKGMSDANIKQSTTLAQRGEAGVRDVKTRNEQSFSERVVADMKNQIERLNRQRRPGADNSAIRAEITKLRGRLLSYSITPDLGFLLAYAKEDLAQLQALRAKFDEMTPDEKSRFFLFANYYINSWATLGEAVDITDTNIADPAQDDLRKQFTEIVGNASLMQAELLELFKDHYAKINQIEDGGQFNLFGDYANTNFFESQFLNISVSKIPLVRKIYDIVQKANYQAAERTKMAKEEIEAQVTQLKKWAKANGISEKDLWDIFKQKDSKGNWTGNYIHEYDQRYYEERSRKYRERFEYERGTPEYQRAIREYNKWVEQNSNTIIEEAKYQEAYEAAKQHYTDENGNLEEGMLNYWENLYSPHKKGDMRFEFVTILPKAEKWGDARFDKIKNTPQLLEFYNFFTEFLNERKKVLPYADALKKPNYLPEMYRKGMEGGIRLGSLVKGIGNSVLSTFTARIKPSKQRLTEDPQTGMAENTIPLYMLNDSLNPNNKEYDLEQVLKNFAAMSYLYEHREQVEPDVLVLRKLFADIRNPESQMDANGRAPYSSITGRFFENRGETRHSNTLAALDYFIESSLYDRKAVDADASSSLAYETINPKTGKPEVRGFSFTRFVEFLIKWTRRRGMGFNSFAASANLFFGVLSNQIEAAAGTHFTTDQANMAFRKMLGVALGGKLTEEGKKILLLMEKFDVVKDYMDTSSEGTFSPSKFDKLLFIMQEKTENFIYGQTFLAVLFNTKIKDKSGKERHLFDAYEVKDGKLAWKEEFGHEEFEDLSDEKYRLKTKIDRLLEDIHGDYNSLNPKLINKTVLGRAIMVFRNWIPQGVQNRFGSLRYDSRLGTHKKGRLLSYGAYFQKNDRDQRDVGRGIADLLRDTSMELAKQTINSFFLGKKIVNYDTMSQLSELDAANMRKNITALRFTLMLMAVALMIKGLTIDDDDDAQVSAIKFILMSIYRTETDLTFYLNPNSQQQLLRDFVPVAGTIGEITDIFDATAQLIAGNDELQSGPNAGRSRFMREAYQSLPALAQIQRLYELQGINIDSRRGY